VDRSYYLDGGYAFIGDLVPMVLAETERFLDGRVPAPSTETRREFRELALANYSETAWEAESFGVPEKTPFRTALRGCDYPRAAELATPEQLADLGLLILFAPVLRGMLDAFVHQYGTMSMDGQGRYIVTDRKA